eukprot:scaffold1690_cov247-Pinguiococcus_pyrenoidosus.AAC.2
MARGCGKSDANLLFGQGWQRHGPRGLRVGPQRRSRGPHRRGLRGGGAPGEFSEQFDRGAAAKQPLLRAVLGRGCGVRARVSRHLRVRLGVRQGGALSSSADFPQARDASDGRVLRLHPPLSLGAALLRAHGHVVQQVGVTKRADEGRM